MSDLRGKITEFYAVEQLSQGNTALHRINPGIKLIVTLVYIVCVVSFDRYALTPLFPFLFYPVIMISLGDIPWSFVIKRECLALPFVVPIALSNILFDRSSVTVYHSMVITAGMLSCVSVIFRTFLSVSALVILMSITRFSDLTTALRRVHIPEVFVLLFEMTYRYIGVLLEEASSMTTAYTLRHPASKGLEMRHMGSFVGSLLIKSFDRAERIYNAMKCRGYGKEKITDADQILSSIDILYGVILCELFIMFRMYNFTQLFGGLFV